MATALSIKLRLPASRIHHARASRSLRIPRTSVRVNAYKIKLITPDGEHEIECDSDTFILDAAEEANIDLPYSCRSGTCSSCAGKVLNGAPVNQDDQQYLEPEQIEKGFAMLCVAYPTGDCTIKTHQEEHLI